MMKTVVGGAMAGLLVVAGLTPAYAMAAETTTDLPLRKTIEGMEGKVTWNDKDRSIQIQVGGVQAVVKLDSTEATFQGKSVQLDKKPYLIDGSAQLSKDAFKTIQNEVIKLQNKTGLELLTTYQMPNKKAEISTSTPDGKTLIVTQADLGSIALVSIENLAAVSVKKEISFTDLSKEAEVTSVVSTPDGKYVLVGVRAGDNVNTANKGYLAVVDIEKQATVKTYEIGVGPDSVTISSDGKYAVVCNEDEEIDPATGEIDMKSVKRPGSISIIEFPNGDVLKGVHTELKIDLTQVGGGVTYPNDPQPEYVASSPDNSKAAITLQENNAIAIVDLASKKIINMFGLGVTKHKADLKSNGEVSITEDMTARPEPDGIVWSLDGKYVITANEGDLGKDEFKDGVKAGGRNIMVWDLQGKAIYDSMELIDKMTAQVGVYPDSRSANKGSEVENLTIGVINGKPMLAVASERASAILFFDITDATKPNYLGLLPSGGESPEGILKVSGKNLFVSSDEVSGTLSFYGVK
ncbi:choice-of-anchor I domain-containing protein [Paenibacillus qinlingensis]|nr:stalk domain-containing protein [Paenibacillus qinlingensis]